MGDRGVRSHDEIEIHHHRGGVGESLFAAVVIRARPFDLEEAAQRIDLFLALALLQRDQRTPGTFDSGSSAVSG